MTFYDYFGVERELEFVGPSHVVLKEKRIACALQNLEFNVHEW